MRLGSRRHSCVTSSLRHCLDLSRIWRAVRSVSPAVARQASLGIYAVSGEPLASARFRAVSRYGLTGHCGSGDCLGGHLTNGYGQSPDSPRRLVFAWAICAAFGFAGAIVGSTLWGALPPAFSPNSTNEGNRLLGTIGVVIGFMALLVAGVFLGARVSRRFLTDEEYMSLTRTLSDDE